MKLRDRIRSWNPFGGEKRSTVSASYGVGDPMLAELWGRLSATASGVDVTPENARRCPEVDACITLIEDTIGTIPLNLYQRMPDGSRQIREDLPLHALLHDKPNSWQTAAEFFKMMEGWRETHGNCYAEIVSGPQGPIALEPMHPREVWPFRTATGGVAYQFTPCSGPVRVLLQSEVLHVRDSPARRWNLLLGESRVERNREAIGLTMATAEYMGRFFSNNATPKSVITYPAGQKVNPDQAEELRKRWEQKHGGLHNAHRMAILEGGFDIKTLGMSNADGQVLESYAFSVGQVCRIFGVPGFLVGDTEKSTSWGTGIEQQSIGFVAYCMRPKFVVWEQALNAAMMSSAMRGRFFYEFDIDGLLRGDFKSRMAGFALQIQWGICTPNEIRKKMNLAPLPGGDERLVPLNMCPASSILDVLLKGGGKPGDPITPAGEGAAADEGTRALVDLITDANRQTMETAA